MQQVSLASASKAAYTRIKDFVRCTPLEPSPWLSSVGSCEAYFKLESEQHTGSFKARGAVNKVLSLAPEEISKGLVTCSTGNHALAFTYARTIRPEACAAPALVYLPTTASPAKVDKLKARGAELQFFGSDCLDAEVESQRVAAERGMTYVSPYNDWEVMAGQGTVAVELIQQLPAAAEAVAGGEGPVMLVPVGGGGLIGGVAAVLKDRWPGCKVVGCQPAASAVMAASVAAGQLLDLPSEETLSDGTAGGIEEGAITFRPCQEYVDEWVTVSEEEIADAMVSMLHHQSKLVEGAAGCAIAAFRRMKEQLAGRQVVVVCCGGNVAVSTLQNVLSIGKVWGS